jgi:hypothetical protein
MTKIGSIFAYYDKFGKANRLPFFLLLIMTNLGVTMAAMPLPMTKK